MDKLELLISEIHGICKEFTSYTWSNSWPHGGPNLTNQSYYMFLIHGNGTFGEFNYEDISGLDICINPMHIGYRVDIKKTGPLDFYTHFFINTNEEFEATRIFLLETIRDSYNYLISLRKGLERVENAGTFPRGLNVYMRDYKLKMLGV